MEIYSIPQSLPGHPDCGTIQIIYNIPPGIQVTLPFCCCCCLFVFSLVSFTAQSIRQAGKSDLFKDTLITSRISCSCPQGSEHPNPGQPYTCRGFPRFCFLPDNDKGRKVSDGLNYTLSLRAGRSPKTNGKGEPHRGNDGSDRVS